MPAADGPPTLPEDDGDDGSSFDARRAAVLSALDGNINDRSPKGSLDAPIAALCGFINASRDWYTTSSCSGRVSVLLQEAGRAKGGDWLYCSHDPADEAGVLAALDAAAGRPGTATLRFEPFVLTAECRTLESATTLLAVAQAAGLRDSGLTAARRRWIVGLRCALRLEAPVAQDGAMLAPPEYVRCLVRTANAKFGANAARVAAFFDGLRAAVVPPHTPPVCDATDPGDSGWAMTVARTDAKALKDALRSAGWLDRHKRSAEMDGGSRVALPLTAGGASALRQRQSQGSHSPPLAPAIAAAVASPGALARVALSAAPGPRLSPHAALVAAAVAAGLPPALVSTLPVKWEMLGGLALLPAGALTGRAWDDAASSLGPARLAAFYASAAAALGADRLGRQAAVDPGGMRASRAVLLHPPPAAGAGPVGLPGPGSPGWVTVREAGVTYSFDATACMFSSGNGTEKARMGALDCRGETVLDLYAGIGYYTLPLLVRAGAAVVHACEWAPAAAAALRHNLGANGIAWADGGGPGGGPTGLVRCVVHEGDNRVTVRDSNRGLASVAHRVVMGLLPSADEGLIPAMVALRPEGGWLHVHGNAPTGGEAAWADGVAVVAESVSTSLGRPRVVSVRGVTKVKSYAPRVTHAVADLWAGPTGGGGRAADADKLEPRPGPSPPASTTRPPWPDIPRIAAPGTAAFAALVAAKTPVVITGIAWPGVTDGRWGAEALASHPEAASTPVSVHSRPKDAPLDFTARNFGFVTLTLAELAAVAGGITPSPPGSPSSQYYLRSVGSDARREPACLETLLPVLGRGMVEAAACLVPRPSVFSSVLRLASPGCRLWTHFDVYDNVLVQLEGTKVVTLFPPQSATGLYLQGSSSPCTGDAPDAGRFPRYAAALAAAAVVTLAPGDALYIPALWPHGVYAETFSVGCNFFFRDPALDDQGGYAPRDVYGNRDPIAAAAALESVGRARAALADLPPYYRAFYAARCAAQFDAA